MLTAADALARVHADLGHPPITHLDPTAGPRAHRAASAAAADHPAGGLIVVAAAHPRALTLPRTWLATGTTAAIELLTTTDAVLLLAHVPGARRRTPAPARPAAWATPDAAPLPNATEADLDDDVLRVLLDRVDERYPAPRGSITERYLGRRGVLAHDGTRWRPTLGAMLVAGWRPELFVPGCAVHLVDDGDTSVHCGPVPELVRRFGEGHVAGVDPDLLAEVVLNALLHRDWSVDTPVRVEVDGPRLTVTSPGHLPTGAGHRHPLLVHFAVALGLATGARRGLRDVTRRLSTARRRPYSLVERSGEVLFVADVRRRRPVLLEPDPPSTPPAPAPPPDPPEPEVTPPPAIPALLPRHPDKRAAAVLAALQSAGHATTRELADALRCSRPVVGKVLTALVAEGRVRATASPGRSPFQAYELVGEPAG